MVEQNTLDNPPFVGWEFSGIATIEGGLPPTVTGGIRIDPAGLGLLDGNSFAGRRPDMIADPNANAPHTLDEWFNPAAFANLPDGPLRPENPGHRTVRGPGLQRWDISLYKNLSLYENLRAQLRIETFNIVDHTDYDTVNTNLSSSRFGSVTGTRDPRILQLALNLPS